ncbi:Transaldolase [Aphelenchoides besseyi]|nr:Transaldolase [Aphelenchoides besseyi]KAI6210565.1 Transaldolase [Aphelenchoides besseyi]
MAGRPLKLFGFSTKEDKTSQNDEKVRLTAYKIYGSTSSKSAGQQSKMVNLEHLKKYSAVVADTGDYQAINQFQPTDATTNPSLILTAAKLEAYEKQRYDAILYALNRIAGKTTDEVQSLAMDKMFVLFGKEILQTIPGRVSTSVDPYLAYNTEGSVSKALALIRLYEEESIDKERILIQLAATWEGIEAARELESKHGIHCNMTLVFNYEQAIACAQANVTLISPFVGPIFDWHVQTTGKKKFARDEDPGVKVLYNNLQFVRKVYNYCKKFGHKTQVMAASFSNTEQIKGLVGCDLLAISPEFLKEIAKDKKLKPVLTVEKAKQSDLKEVNVTEQLFHSQFKEDAMATEKLEEEIRKFKDDARLLKELIDRHI